MATPGRNDPCHCGSGLKYKKCCAGKDAAADSQRLAQNKARIEEEETQYRARLKEFGEFHRAKLSGELDEDDEDNKLVEDSNAILDMVHAGSLDEAEVAAHAFLERFPYVHDGYDRLGMVEEARGNSKAAADWYRMCLQFVREHRQYYEPAVEERYEHIIAKLDPTPA